MRKALPFILLTVLALLASGCRSNRSPSESDTVLRSAYSDSATADYVSGDTVNVDDSLAAQGLASRSGSFASISESDVTRGVLPSVYFDFDKAAIRSSEREKLQQASDYLKTNPSRRILIEGHCDWRGTSEYNLGLGDRRARSAKEYLTTLGIEESRIGTVSKGDLEAIQNGSEDQMAQDRRADLLLINN